MAYEPRRRHRLLLVLRSVALNPGREQVPHVARPLGNLKLDLDRKLLAEVDGHLAVLR